MAAVKRPRTRAERQARLDAILAALDHLYPNVTCALHHNSPWELLVATILSAQCTDERVNMVTPELFRIFPTIKDLASAEPRDVGRVIYSTGFYNNKAKNIVGAAQTILVDFNGEVPQEIDKLLTVPGAARKTANVVLGTCFGIASGVVVDTHVSRISQRLDLTREKTPEKIERDLMKMLPQERWISVSHQVIHFGRGICVARSPRCGQCPVEGICYAADKTV
jgi:endonuclease III